MGRENCEKIVVVKDTKKDQKFVFLFAFCLKNT
jgi:hypothetical protein